MEINSIENLNTNSTPSSDMTPSKDTSRSSLVTVTMYICGVEEEEDNIRGQGK